MAGISASKTRLAYVPETAWGVVPATPPFEKIRFTGESLAADKQTVVSNEIREDRNVSDLIQVGRSGAGNIDAEFSYGTFDDWFSMMLCSEWGTDVLKNGVLEKSMLLEKTFMKSDGSPIMHRYGGTSINTMSLGITAQQLVTLGFGVMSKGVAQDIVPVTGATYADATTTSVLSASADFGSLVVTGLGASPLIQGLTLEMTNNLRQQNVVGSMDSAGQGYGRFALTGTMNVYFEDEAIYDAFLDHTSVDLEFTLGTEAGSRYKFELPNIKLSGGNPTAGGNDQDVMMNMNWQALYDATSEATITITRAV
ncbi:MULTISPECIES: phage tail tube protein [Aurantimonas]|uniref:phage tail tube protein n=1 Tax=Aurantimonas TaxID=182269 RepID=UPI00351447EF